MTSYTASEEDMKQYASLLRDLAVLDLQRNQVLQALGQWEQAHIVQEAEPIPDGTDGTE